MSDQQPSSKTEREQQRDARLGAYASFVARLQGFTRAERAILRRSLNRPTGEDWHAYRFLALSHEESEALNEKENGWSKRMRFLIAGLIARQEPSGRTPKGNLGDHARTLAPPEEQQHGVERRFLALLDADRDELPQRLVDFCSLLISHDIPINWPQLLEDLRHWSTEHTYTQQRWADHYYNPRYTNDASPDSSTTPEGPPA